MGRGRTKWSPKILVVLLAYTTGEPHPQLCLRASTHDTYWYAAAVRRGTLSHTHKLLAGVAAEQQALPYSWSVPARALEQVLALTLPPVSAQRMHSSSNGSRRPHLRAVMALASQVTLRSRPMTPFLRSLPLTPSASVLTRPAGHACFFEQQYRCCAAFQQNCVPAL